MGQSLAVRLAAVLRHLMATHPDLDTSEKIEKATERKSFKVGKSTIHRASTGESVLRADNLEAIAAAFGMKASELLRLCEEPSSKESLADLALSRDAEQLIDLIRTADSSRTVSDWSHIRGVIEQLIGGQRPAKDNAGRLRGD